ncbi:MAG: adenylate/guanylate cyclase domain-containing protein [Pseudomonadota bacterium]
MAKLILISSPERQEFELGQFDSIGRHPGNTIQILDRIISKEHAQIRRSPDGRFILRDLGSLNGTYIHGERVGEWMLRDGDEIALGSTRLLFVDHKDEEAALNRVTIAPGTTESHIRQRMSASDSNFLPEREAGDELALRRDYERLRIGHELAKALGAELDLDKLLPKILDKAFEMLNPDRGVILLMDSNGQLVPRYVKQKDSRQESIVLSKTVLSEVVTQKSAVLSSDATMDSRFSGAHSIIMQGIRSTMTVPLLFGEEILGIMHLDSQIATNAFTDKDLQIFTGIASQAAIAIQNARLAKKIEQEAQTRAQFQRLIPPKVLEQVVSGKLTIEKGGKLCDVTMLYSDIRGFTAMSERKSPQDIVSMLNEYFEVMVDILFKQDGTLDKFVGDEIIALFGAPIEIEDAPLKAVSCALEMQKALQELNCTRAAENHEAIRIGIGINTGTVLTGAIGSSKAMQYTAIGDPMNVASRLCSAAKPDQIIVSESTMALIADQVEAISLPSIEVKGKRDKLKIYNVVGLKGKS